MSIERRQILLTSAAFAFAGAAARAQPNMSGDVLKAVWVQGNPVQARVSAEGKPQGPAIDMAEAIARRLGKRLEVTAVAAADAVLERVRNGAADLAFIGYDPARAQGLAFTPPYLLALESYAVTAASKIRSADEVDRAGVRIGAVPTGPAGLYLKRTVKNATLVPIQSFEAGVQQLKAGAFDVLAGASQRIIDASVTDHGIRALPGRFFEVPQSIAVRELRHDLLTAASAAVAEARTSGALAASIKRWKLAGAAAPETPPAVSAQAAVKELAPSGRLRAAINLGNSVLAQKDAKTGELTGISVILARELANRLGVPIDLRPYQAAGDTFDAMERGEWDVAFLGIELERAARIDFSPPYVAIDGTYLVRTDSPYKTVADLDRPGVKISVGRGAAYDLYLSRNLKKAELRRAPTSVAAIDLFMSDNLDAAAGVRQALAERSKGRPEFRVMEDRFSRIDQAIGVPKGHPVGAAYVRNFIEEMKATGKVRAGLDATGQNSALVAPPA